MCRMTGIIESMALAVNRPSQIVSTSRPWAATDSAPVIVLCRAAGSCASRRPRLVAVIVQLSDSVIPPNFHACYSAGAWDDDALGSRLSEREPT